MKKLLIIRHAKSSWDNDKLHDIERPLAERGERDAILMAKRLLKKSIHPDLILSSPALRAFSTARIFCDVLGIDKNKIEIRNQLYSEGANTVIDMLQSLGSQSDVVCIFGHNPTFSHLAAALCHEFRDEMPTCGTVELDFEVSSWGLIGEGGGRLSEFDYPKKHR